MNLNQSVIVQCGIANILPKPRIQNGKPTGPNKYPWMVNFAHKDKHRI